MTAYVSSPAGPPPVELLPGVTGYAFGSRNLNKPTVRMTITSVAVSGNVATVGVQIVEGYIPSVGDLITVTGTTTIGGAANVTNQAITAVNITATTGAGTISFALTHADQSVQPDTGMGFVPIPEVGEALANGTSQAFAIPSKEGFNDNGLTITWSTRFPSSPGSVTMTLEAAMENEDSQFITLDTSTNVTADERLITLTRFRFLRIRAANVAGGSSPTVIARIDI